MKKILVIVLSAIIGVSASAQKRIIVRPSVPAGPGVIYYSRPYWNPYFYGGLGYSWYNRPAYYYNRPTKMERQIQDIVNDYNDRISSVRADDDLSGRERRSKIRALRHEREQAIYDLRRNYYKQYEN